MTTAATVYRKPGRGGVGERSSTVERLKPPHRLAEEALVRLLPFPLAQARVEKRHVGALIGGTAGLCQPP